MNVFLTQGKMDTTPVLEVENDTPVLEVENVIISIGTDSITETIKELNQNARRNDLTVSI